MLVNTPISIGELIDKISILIIKKKNIIDVNKLKHIEKELSLLESTLSESVNDKKVKEFRDSLIEINSTLWKIEDDIRKCEKDKAFDQKFIDLARAVYQTNDKRSEIKLEINEFFGSTLVEVKSYEKY